ncbi:MAG: DNA repair protein RecO [Nevskiaceae bacterium]|nr:MAG: DNA repair protein RecO [Nevskiaceae bacterium]TBR74658.1 MAG: DNA repair protein RecO [Nevskiaceae bacterium]
MPRERVTLEPAWLLARRPYRETSALLELLTAEHGRVGLVARGASGARSKLRGMLQMFQPLLVSWTASGDLGTLTGVESAGRGMELAGERVFFGWYVNELLLRLLERHAPQPEVHAAYGTVVAALAGEGAETALRRFEVTLLEALGYGLPLEGVFDPSARYRWDPEQGVQPGGGGREVSGAALLALRSGQFEAPDTRREVQALLRTAIDRRLDGRELKARRLLREMRQRS